VVLRPIAVASLVLGAAASIAFTLYAGRHNPSQLLRVLFFIWVLAPFAGLACGVSIAKRRSWLPPDLLDALMLIVSVASAGFYARAALSPPRAQAAFAFVFLPLASWILMVLVTVVASVAYRIRRRR
jgi:hypothetical protein